MRVSSIDLYSNDHQVVQFDVNGPDVRNPYMLKGITGLDASSIVPRFYSKGAESGTNFYDLTLEPREIALKIGLNPNYNLGDEVSDLRGDLYRAIASSRKGTVQLRFNDGPACVAAIEGFVTNFDAPTTEKDVQVTINLRCDDPIFKSLEVTNQILDNVFPDTLLIIEAGSTSPHGFKFVVNITAPQATWAIADPDGDWEFRFDYGLLTGDDVYFSSEAGDKYLYVVSGVDTIQLMDTLVAGSVWPILFPGENHFEVSAPDFQWDAIYWYETHWGV